MNPIGWCDETWNPITGCTPISEGCKNCYAARMAKRLAGRFGYPKDDPFRPGTGHDLKVWQKPNHWKKPRRIFVCSMGDLFHEAVSEVAVYNIIDRIQYCSWHTFIILTKRPERARIILDGCFDFVPNLWLGVSCENQAAFDERWDVLSQIPAAKRIISAEPLLSPLDIITDCATLPDWVICGPETGPGARFMELKWAYSLLVQCASASVPFFYKRPQDTLAPQLQEFPEVTT